jgi:hypothetical protein
MKFMEAMGEFDYKMTNIARALGVSKQLVGIWKRNNHIPYQRQCQLEILTNGKIKAER